MINKIASNIYIFSDIRKNGDYSLLSFVEKYDKIFAYCKQSAVPRGPWWEYRESVAVLSFSRLVLLQV